MTVYIEKPELSLRGELASLRNQGTYQEQQFYFDGLVTNGTFDADTTGWTATACSVSVVNGAMRITDADGGIGYVSYRPTLEIGKTYLIVAQVVTDNMTGNMILNVGTSNGSGQLGNQTLTTTGSYSFTFTTTVAQPYVNFRNTAAVAGDYWDVDNVFIYETDGTDVIHTMPKGWKPKDVFEDGLLQREGAAHDYEVVYNGFDYVVKPTVAPSATTQTCVIGVKA